MAGSDEPTPRQRAARRGAKARAARKAESVSERFATITVILDREECSVTTSHEWMSVPEAYGAIVAAESWYRDLVTGNGAINQDGD